MFCPFCLSSQLQKSWLSVRYLDKTYDYLECSDCGSCVCDPMPDEATLMRMYGPDYYADDAHAERFDRVLGLLNGDGGVFLDFGCGSGELLEMAAKKGYKPVGVEFNPKTVAAVREKLGFDIVTPDQPTEPADILHLGDVIEHLTDIDTQLASILERLKPGGTLIAHNPLEANPNFYNSVISLSRRVRGGAVDGVPYHVTLATTEGQKKLFERFGITEKMFEVDEIAFPAPDRLGEIDSPKRAALYFLRRASQLISRIRGVQRSGNRYLFVGTKT